MKQNLFKTWLMLLCLFIGIGSAWAEEATIIFASGTNSGTNYYFQNTSGSITDVLSFSSAKNSSTTNPAYNANSSELRLYGHNNSSANGGSITLTAVDGVTFTGFELTVSSATTSAYTAGTNSPVSLSYSSSKATVSNFSCSTLKFQNKNASTTQFKIKSIKVTYTTNGGGGGDPNPTTYTVTVANNIANGTVTASPTSATEGTEVTLTATPATGYEFGSWDVKDASSNAITVTNNKFTMPAANVNVSATFNAIQGGGETGGDETFVTFDNLGFTSWGKSASFSGSTYDELSQTKSDVVFDYTRGSGSTYANTTSIRFYKDNKLKFTAPKGYKITSIVWTGSSFKNDVTTDVETCTSTTSALSWSGNASSVTFTRPSAATSYATLSSVSVTIIADTPPTPTDKTLVSISATGTPATFWKGDDFNHEGITVTATWDDETTTDVTSSCSYTGYDMSTAGDQTVTVTYLEKTATYGINVKTIANTQETAYTTAEAKALIDTGKDLATEVYVKGTVSKVESYNESHGSITYWLDENSFEIYGGLAQNGEKFSGLDDIKEGATVVVYGVIKKYSSTYEMDKNNVLVSYSEPAAKIITALEVNGTPTKTTYNIGDAFETAGLVVTATYSDETQEVISTGFDWEIDYGTGNDALVAGATSVDVMAYIDEVMSEVYTVNGLTVTVPVTLTSIAVSGTPTKTEYYAGDAFETAGLVVTGTYSDSHQETITEAIEWTIDPETLTLGTTSVDVIAGVGSVFSEVYTVEGLTVTENPVKTATKNGFTTGDNSGSHNFTDNTDISFEAFKGNAGTAPAINSNNLRLYQNGAYVTITGAAGVSISQVKITTGSTYASTTVGYCVDDEDAPTTGETVEKNTEYTIKDLNNQSVSIYCLGTDKSTRLDIAAIEVKYTKENITLSSIALSGEYQTEFIQNQTFNHNGIVVTANFSNGQSEDVTAKAEFTNPDLTTTGTKTITVSYTDGDITKTADYEITVAEEVVTALTLSGEYQTTFRAGDEFNHDNLIIEATYNSGRTGIDVTSTATISTPDMSIEGEQTITVSYGGQNTSYTIKVLSENTIFYESFDTNNGTGGNDGQWSGSIASNNISSDNEGWNFASSGGANKCAKFGAGSAAGLATTPALGYEGDAIMTFKSAAWNSNNETLKVNLSVEGEGEISQTSITNKKGEWTTYTVLLTGLTAESKVKFEAANSSNNRFFLDEILITRGQNINLVATAKDNEVVYYYATFSSDKNVEFVDATVYTVTVEGDALALNEVSCKQVPSGKGVLIKTTKNKAAYKNIAEATELGDNYLVACTTGTCPEVEGVNLYYKLAYGNASEHTQLGFWYGAEGGSNDFNVKAGGAVLVVPQSVGGAVRGFSFDGNNGVVTGLNNLNNLNNTKSAIYNLQGQHISKAQKGVNIINGRKVIR